MSGVSPGFSVVIPTVGRAEQLTATLRSVLATDPRPHQIIVVDGDANGGAAEAIKTAGTDADEIEHLITERGLTRQRNTALAAIDHDIVVFLDDDVDIPTDTFEQLSTAYQDEDVVGATGHVIEPDGGRVGGKTSRIRKLMPGGGREGGFTSFGYPRRLTDVTKQRDVSFMQGCFMTARTPLARQVLFDEELAGYALAEDEDFSYRLSQLGRIRYLPHLRVLHHNTGFATRDHRAFSRQVVKNRLYLFRKNFSQTIPARIGFWLLILVLVVHRIINREWSGAKGLIEASLEEWRR